MLIQVLIAVDLFTRTAQIWCAMMWRVKPEYEKSPRIIPDAFTKFVEKYIIFCNRELTRGAVM
jgi:hypothetical protein